MQRKRTYRRSLFLRDRNSWCCFGQECRWRPDQCCSTSETPSRSRCERWAILETKWHLRQPIIKDKELRGENYPQHLGKHKTQGYRAVLKQQARWEAWERRPCSFDCQWNKKRNKIRRVKLIKQAAWRQKWPELAKSGRKSWKRSGGPGGMYSNWPRATGWVGKSAWRMGVQLSPEGGGWAGQSPKFQPQP